MLHVFARATINSVQWRKKVEKQKKILVEERKEEKTYAKEKRKAENDSDNEN